MKKTTKRTISLFWEHSRQHRLLLFVILVSIAGTSVTLALRPLYYRDFFNMLANSAPGMPGAARGLAAILMIVFLLYGIEWALYRVASFGNNRLQPKIMASITNRSFEYLHGHSYRFFTDRFVGTLVRRVNRFTYAFEALSDILYWELFPTALRALLILGVLFWVNWAVGTVMLVWIAAYLAINFRFAKKKLKYDKQNAAMDSKATGRLADTITNNVNIKMFASLSRELSAFRRLIGRQTRIRVRTWDFEAKIDAAQGALMTILEIGIFLVAIHYWNLGFLTIGDFVLIQSYLVSIFMSVYGFGRVVRRMYRHLADSEEMSQIFGKAHDVRDRRGSAPIKVEKGIVEFKDVTFRYAKTRKVLDDFSLKIAPGEKIGLVGPSGAGKSTIIKLILRFYDLHDGSILIDGQDISRVTQDSLRQNVSLVPQDPILFHRSLRDNIRYGKPSATEREIVQASKLAHAHEFITEAPQGYDTFVGERGIKLSGGERQRVAIARAMIKNAPVLILDEATSSLDSESEAKIQAGLDNLMKGRTTMVIAHRLSTIMKMDRIIVLDRGRIVEQGTHEKLLAKKGSLYKRLWEMQAGGFLR